MPEFQGAGAGCPGWDVSLTRHGDCSSCRYGADESREAAMSLFAWLMLGVVVGYLGSLIMRSEPDRGVLLSTAAGILGALVAGRLLAPILGGAPGRGFFGTSAVIAALLGAVILVGLVNFLRLGRLR